MMMMMMMMMIPCDAHYISHFALPIGSCNGMGVTPLPPPPPPVIGCIFFSLFVYARFLILHFDLFFIFYYLSAMSCHSFDSAIRL
jgi:hypothetical protein